MQTVTSTAAANVQENASQLFARLVSQSTSVDTSGSITFTSATIKPPTTVEDEASRALRCGQLQLRLNKTLPIDRHLFGSGCGTSSGSCDGGVANREIVEIYGKLDSGKSELIMHLIARYLLPPTWQIQTQKAAVVGSVGRHDSSSTCYTSSLSSSATPGNDTAASSQFCDAAALVVVDLCEFSCFADTKTTSGGGSGNKNGQQCYAQQLLLPSQMPKCVLINTDGKFSMLRLFSIMESRINAAVRNNKLVANIQSTQKAMGKFIKECLKNLVVFRCFSGEQFIFALSACESYLYSLHSSSANSTSSGTSTTSTRPIVPIFIDTINANYDIVDKYLSQLTENTDADRTEKFVVAQVKRLVERHNVCVIATRLDTTDCRRLQSNKLNASACAASGSEQRHWRKWQGLVSRRVELSRLSEEENIDNCDNDENKTKCSNHSITASNQQLDERRYQELHKKQGNRAQRYALKVVRQLADSNEATSEIKGLAIAQQYQNKEKNTTVLVDNAQFEITNAGFEMKLLENKAFPF